MVVLGRDGEPFARVGANGVEVNRHSSTWADNARAQGQDLAVAAAVIDPGAAPEWSPVTGTQSYSWLEFRGLYERDRPPRRAAGRDDLEAELAAATAAWPTVAAKPELATATISAARR